ncbi:hypothetical protein ACVIHH_003031 [Bradyrhizobium sp. USDA 4518]
MVRELAEAQRPIQAIAQVAASKIRDDCRLVRSSQGARVGPFQFIAALALMAFDPGGLTSVAWT